MNDEIEDLGTNLEGDEASNEGEETKVIIGGKEYAEEEAAELISKGSDYTQKTQALAAERKALEEQASKAVHTPVQELDAEEELARILPDGGTAEETSLAKEIVAARMELRELRELNLELVTTYVKPIWEAHEAQSKNSERVTKFASAVGRTVTADEVSSALSRAGGDELKAVALLSSGKLSRDKPITPGAKDRLSNPTSKMTPDELAEWGLKKAGAR